MKELFVTKKSGFTRVNQLIVCIRICKYAYFNFYEFILANFCTYYFQEEVQSVHGKIRCHNILVASHTDNSFKVKLADPGVIVYSDVE